ncbi:MAG: UDP-N-acetylmuramoyl-tripeptide--D-alanyl-D-alanine ligase [Simkaniaceae bacterium]|nr:UDP-N-acetylmuramoyl-tripeptide--D-alanyl-D-alanine ligase [Candidatus Sacchlamyda saccharinae]
MWNLKKIAKILRWPCEVDALVKGFAIDSRLVKRGEVFFALSGEKVDGHEFLEEVAAHGALAAVVSKKYTGKDFGLCLLRVDDVNDALHRLAKVAFSNRKETVVAITGSMGKTTTKEFTATLLAQKYRVAKTPGNWNTQLTLPLTLLNLEGEYDVLVLEMGMGRHGEISQLVEMAPPDIAMVTKIAPAGLEDFRGGLEAVAKAKGEIFSHPKTRLGIVSAQAASFASVLYEGAPKWIYGLKEDFSDVRDGDFVMDGAQINDSLPVELSFDAAHLKENFLAAVCVARSLGVSWKDIASGAKKCKPYSMRFEKIERGGVTFINDCYNANPHSTVAALKALPKAKEGGKVLAVLGEMADLGSSSHHYHAEVGKVAADAVDHLFCVGEKTRPLAEQFSRNGKSAEIFVSGAAAKEKMASFAKPGDVVLIKGSNYLKLWEILKE